MAPRAVPVSPGAALLRSSRLFSIPKPLPDPCQSDHGGRGRISPTMTRPYPLSQAITSPFSSREKGDWGFKRPFPLRTTMGTSTPLIRVKEVDSVESVTDFASAADYTISLEKFQELRLAVSVPSSVEQKAWSDSKTNRWVKSVFERQWDYVSREHSESGRHRPIQEPPRESADQKHGAQSEVMGSADQADGQQTEPTAASGVEKSHQWQERLHGSEKSQGPEKPKGNSIGWRWKFKGPWLARMEQGEFDKFLEKHVRTRRAEFQQLLMKEFAKDMTAENNSAARDKGIAPPPPVKVQDISNAQLNERLRQVRYDRVFLFDLVSKFLDLAPLESPDYDVVSLLKIQSPDRSAQGPYGKKGPPPCHPSAGISYLRTNAFMENHPVYGPQHRRSPVLSRVVAPRSPSKAARLAVGGFVAVAPVGDSKYNTRNSRAKVPKKDSLDGLLSLDATTYGGAKAWVQPQTATVSSDGKVTVELAETSEEATLVVKEALGLSSPRETIYDDSRLDRHVPGETPAKQGPPRIRSRIEVGRTADRVMHQVASQRAADFRTPRV